MSWFYGHLFPGTMWWLMGLYVWIQSMHRLSWTNKFRTQPKWLAFRSASVMLAAFLGSIGEIVVPIIDKNSVNWGHIIVWWGFSISAGTELLHLYKVLNEPVWALFSCGGLCFVSLMFQFHDQPLHYWFLLHLATSYGTIPLVLILGIWTVRNQQLVAKQNKKKHVVYTDNPPVSWCFWRNRTLEDLNPIYTDLTIYDTCLPGLLAFFLMLQGALWFEMLYEMGWYTMDNLPPEPFPGGKHAPHKMLETLIKDIIICMGVMIAASWVAHKIEAVKKSREGASVTD